MKKLSFVGARILATFAVTAAIAVFAVICFLPERTVYISGGVSYSPIYCANPEKAGVALMFNVYENAENVGKIIEKLGDHGAKATFFVGGCWADDNAETLKLIVSSGNEIANHGYFHSDHKKLSEAENRTEIARCHDLVKAVTGVDMTLFAPPSGAYGEATLKAADGLNYKTIMWTVDTIDWRDDDRDIIFKRATEKAQSGAFILMHPKDATVAALDDILSFYEDKNVACVTVSECLNDL